MSNNNNSDIINIFVLSTNKESKIENEKMAYIEIKLNWRNKSFVCNKSCNVDVNWQKTSQEGTRFVNGSLCPMSWTETKHTRYISFFESKVP